MENKSKIIIGISILSVLIITLLITMIVLLKGNTNFKMNFNISTKVSSNIVHDEIYENNYNQIKIDQKQGDIEIKKSTDNKIRVVVYGEEEKLKINKTENLSIEYEEDNCTFFCIKKYLSKIEIYLPESYQKEIEIKNKYGDINIDSFKNAIIKIDADCGDIIINEIKDATIKNAYGDIEIEKATDLDIKAECGDVKIGEANSLKIENNYGDIEIDKITDTINVKEDCGDISINQLEIKSNSTITNSYGDIEIKNINDVFIDAETSLGKTDIKKNNRKSNIILEIKNSCGDIEVE